MTPSTPKSNSGLGLAIATAIAILATLLVNTLSNFFPPGGANVGEIANTILGGVLITPANYAFAIWGLIYVGLIAYGVYQLRPNQRTDVMIRRVDTLLILACVAQVIWIYLFTLQLFWVSVLAMLVILGSLIGAYLAFDIGRVPASRDRRWMAHIPFSVYLGWISVATVVNIASALYASNWNGWGISGVTWTVIMILVSAIIAGIVAIQRVDLPFVLVFVWAYGAIALRHLDTAAIWITAVVGAIALIGTVTGMKLKHHS